VTGASVRTASGFTAEDVRAGDLGGEPHACLGIEVQPVFSAPRGEVVRINVYSDHPTPTLLLDVAATFGPCQPLIVGPTEFLTIFEHVSEPDVVLSANPHHSDDLFGHETSGANDTTRVKEAL
jgi:hypothetical protein